MGSSAGRRHKAHIAWRNYFRLNNVPCWECGGPPFAADHTPPLSNYRTQHEWEAAGGTYRSHCQYHSAKQGADITNQRKHPEPSRHW